ncbi:hypothetical protein MMC12_006656 [Toensbergia leucococca]|nr:hypothetical protein [Toensbergia leucococca]
MSSTHTSLDAASTERKARLTKLKSLKRKPPSPSTSPPLNPTSRTSPPPPSYLSNRNYDPMTRGPKLGFENPPSLTLPTLETRASAIAETTTAEAEAQQEERPIDLFRLQPRRPNWDLKRDVERRMEGVRGRTEEAIARLVRERVGKLEGAGMGIGGGELVEGVRGREKEGEEEERRGGEEEGGV